MPRTSDQFESEGDYEGEEDWHYDIDDSLPTRLCPYCQEEILEDTPKCPYCGDYISAEDTREKPYPRWITATAIALLAAMAAGLIWI